ncbi:MAG: glycosyltransferase family 4 protein [bacterium]
MNILFLTLVNIDDINERGIYNDLIRKFGTDGHKVYIVSPNERRLKRATEIISKDNIQTLKVKTFNIQKTNIIEKGIGTLLIEYQFLNGIKKYLPHIKFDLVLYSTPPITYAKIISYIKKRDNAICYLLLKDIFPQNAVDLGLIKKNSFLHKYFKKKENNLYKLSDYIGCMSPANIEHLKHNNPQVNPEKIELNPNSIDPVENILDSNETNEIKKRYNIPNNKNVFLYGGNLGLPQGIDFLIDVLSFFKLQENIFFLIIGSGTMYPKIQKWFTNNNPANAILMEFIPKTDYDKIVQICDAGMIFLDPRFTIPNFPSRLLSYLENKKPVVLATDTSTDIGKIAIDNNFGLWSKSGDLQSITKNINTLISNQKMQNTMGINGYNYFIHNCTTYHSYSTIIKHF